MNIAVPDYEGLRDAVQRSRGWYKTIVRESGCSYVTLRNIANRTDYDPPISEVSRIAAWFAANGIPTRHPRAKATSRRQTEPGAAA